MDPVLGIVNGYLSRDSHDGMLHWYIARGITKANQPEHRRRVDEPASRPITSCIRLARLLCHHLSDSIFTAEPDSALVDRVPTVVVLGRFIVDAQRKGVFCFGR